MLLSEGTRAVREHPEAEEPRFSWAGLGTLTGSTVSCAVPSPEAPTEVPPCCERKAVTAQCTEELELTDDRYQKPVRPNVGQTQVMGIGYRDKDEESVKFFDGLSATVCGDKDYIRVHLGRHS